MYIIVVFISNYFCNSHVSVMNEWSTNQLVTKTFMKFEDKLFSVFS